MSKVNAARSWATKELQAERATVLFFTGRRVKTDFFRPVPGGVELAPPGRAALIENLNQRLDKAVKYPVQRSSKAGVNKYRRVKLRNTIQHESHSFANRLLGKNDIPRIVDVEDLFPGKIIFSCLPASLPAN